MAIEREKVRIIPCDFRVSPFSNKPRVPGFAGFGPPKNQTSSLFRFSSWTFHWENYIYIYIYIYYIYIIIYIDIIYIYIYKYFDLAKSEVVVTKKVISKVLSQWPQPFPHWLPRPVGCPALSWPWPPGMPPPGLPSAAGAAWDGERGLTSLRRLRLGSCRVLSCMCIICPNSMSISYDRNMTHTHTYIYIYT